MDALHVDDPAEVGPYRLRGRLGAGRMGVVFLGRDGAGRDVAVKVVHPHLSTDPGFASRFAHEIALARAASEPGLARIVDADPEGERSWVATEFVAGPSLGQRVQASGALPQREAHDLAVQLAEGLAALHRAGVVHRDLTPWNVLLADDGPRLVDFGLAKALDGAAIADRGYAIGAPAYMSPEQASGGETGKASDVFSLASVLTFAATGRSPFGSASGPIAMLLRVSRRDPDISEVAEPLRTSLSACLADTPVRRPTSEELVESLRHPTPAPERRPPVGPVAMVIPPATPAPARTYRRRWILGGIASAAAVGIGTTVVVTNQPAPTPGVAPAVPSSPPPPPPAARKFTLVDQQVLRGHRTAVHYGVFSPDGRILATGSQDDDTSVRLWDPSNGQPIGAPFESEFSAAFSPDSRILATGGDRGKVVLRDSVTGRETGQLDARLAERNWVNAIAFSPDGRVVATRAEDYVSLWDVAGRTLLKTWPDTSKQWSPQTVRFMAGGGSLLLSGGVVGPQQWDVGTGQSVWAPGGTGPATLSADGGLLAVGDEMKSTKLVVYDTRKRTPVLDSTSLSGGVISPDGTVIASGNGVTWDVASGQKIGDVNVRGFPLAFSPDMTILAYALGWEINLLRIRITAA